MPPRTPIKPENRYDFRKGVNTRFSPDILDRQEVVKAQNLTLDEAGALTLRKGSYQHHSDQLDSGAAILGLFVWDAPAGKEMVAVTASGNCYTKLTTASTWTLRSGVADLSLTVHPGFATHRSGGTLSLYIADGAALFKWDGTTWAAIAGAPTGTMLEVYKNRMVLSGDTNFPKRVWLSVIGDPSDWSTANGAIIGDAEQYDQEAVTGLAKVGSSLLIFKPDAIQRLTGVAAEDLVWDRDSEGVSRNVGAVSRRAIVEIEHAVMFLSKKGVYIATEASAQPIGTQLKPVWKAINTAHWSKAVAVDAEDAREFRLYFPSGTDTTNLTGWFYNYEVGGWTGPHSGIAVSAIVKGEISTGTIVVFYGGYDGWIRRVADSTDVYQDDQDIAGAGGTDITFDAEFPTLFFGSPAHFKDLDYMNLEADMGDGGRMTTYWTIDRGPENAVEISSEGDGIHDYDVGRLDAQGKRVKLGLRGTVSEKISIHGFLLDAALAVDR